MKPLERWAAVQLQTDDRAEAKMLAEALRNACQAGAVEFEPGELAVPQRRMRGRINGAPVPPQPQPPARTVEAFYITAPAFVQWLKARGFEPSPRVRAWLVASVPDAPVFVEPPPKRTGGLKAVIKRARAEAADPDDWPSGWAALVRIAQDPKRPAPLLGYTEGEGVKYLDDDADEARFLTRDAFRKRHGRAKAGR